MKFIHLSTDENIATIVLNRPKVNAINEIVVEELGDCFQKLATDQNVKAVILTGEGSFFSFGLDVPEFLGYSKDSFTEFLIKFTDLYSYIFQFPKPVVAALNGHTIAGGCMLALACDYRLMVSEKAKISLNEITFGSTVFHGSVQMLKYCIGERSAESVLYGGSMYSAEEAKGLGLIDEVVSKDNLREVAEKVAQNFAGKDSRAFRDIKMLLRKHVAEEMRRREHDSILEFADIWYSESTREKLKKIKIRD
ncbi:MAG: enoyl-CoA hydratase/isomerase family protein [Candidatus Dadabacteria bacterium]|nr:enoyl-CoA hydratase/isomerase family protein [Candidatus Dadabacteria bacterium]